MKRNKKKGVLDALAHAHWSAGIIVGILVFALFRFGAPVALNFVFAQMGNMSGQAPPGMPASILSSFTWIGLVAMLMCWLAAGMSAIMAKNRRALLDTQTGIESIRNLSWQDFERLVAEAYRRQGYQVKENGGGGKDGGIDLLLKKGGQTFMVQCKQWRSAKVSAPVAREMWGLVAHHGFDGVKIVSVGSFTDDAAEFAKGKAMELVSGEQLVDLIASVRSRPVAQGVNPVQKPKLKWAPGTRPSEPTNVSLLHPLCPKCRSKMVLRTSRNTQDDFWGCGQYPSCKGTRPLE